MRGNERMSFNYPFAIPTLIPGDINVRTTSVSKIYPIQTVGPYTSWKLPVRAATTANITLEGIQTIDGVALDTNDRVLVTSQTIASENGIYVVTSSITVAGFWSRANDLPTGSSAANICVFVNEGILNADLMFICTNAIGDDIVDVDNLVFTTYGDILAVVPGGSNGQVQYNNNGTFGGSSLFTFNPNLISSSVSFPVTVLGQITLGSATSLTTSSNITAPNAVTSSGNAGKAIVISGGQGDGSGQGGTVELLGGYSPSGQGGNVRLVAGQGAAQGGGVAILSGSSTGISGNIILTANATGSTKGVIELITSTITTTFTNGGVNFTKDTGGSLTIANLSGSPAATSTSRQGIITITDPSALAGGASITITVTNTSVLSNDVVNVYIQTFDTGGSGTPMVLVSSVTPSTGFTIQLYNLAVLHFSVSPLQIAFQLS